MRVEREVSEVEDLRAVAAKLHEAVHPAGQDVEAHGEGRDFVRLIGDVVDLDLRVPALVEELFELVAAFGRRAGLGVLRGPALGVPACERTTHDQRATMGRQRRSAVTVLCISAAAPASGERTAPARAVLWRAAGRPPETTSRPARARLWAGLHSI
jgi:hypothetical protein